MVCVGVAEVAEVSFAVLLEVLQCFIFNAFFLEIDEYARTFPFVLQECIVCHLQLFLGVFSQSGVEQEYNNVTFTDIFIIPVLQSFSVKRTAEIHPGPLVEVYVLWPEELVLFGKIQVEHLLVFMKLCR